MKKLFDQAGDLAKQAAVLKTLLNGMVETTFEELDNMGDSEDAAEIKQMIINANSGQASAHAMAQNAAYLSKKHKINVS